MPVSEVNEIVSRRSSETDLSGSTYQRKLIRAYRVVCELLSDGPATARLADGIPRIGDMDVDDTSLWCRHVTADVIDEAGLVYEVTAEFFAGSEFQKLEPQGFSEQASDVVWGFATSYEDAVKDIDGNLIGSSAKEVFDPPPQREVSYLTLTISRNEGMFDALQAAEYKDSLNDDFFWGFAAGHVRITDTSSNSVWDNGQFYWRTTYQFAFKPVNKWPHGWDMELLDQGTREWKFVFTGTPPEWHWELSLCLDPATGMPYNQPIPFDGSGHPLASSTDPLVYRVWQLYPRKDFSALGLR